jgi:hypothetical protein
VAGPWRESGTTYVEVRERQTTAEWPATRSIAIRSLGNGASRVDVRVKEHCFSYCALKHGRRKLWLKQSSLYYNYNVYKRTSRRCSIVPDSVLPQCAWTAAVRAVLLLNKHVQPCPRIDHASNVRRR